jgi:hypothetical protein
MNTTDKRAWKIGDRVLLPDFSAGTIELMLEGPDGWVDVRCDSWEGLGVPSCLLTCIDSNLLLPLPLGYVPEQHSIAERLQAARFGERINEAAESLLGN